MVAIKGFNKVRASYHGGGHGRVDGLVGRDVGLVVGAVDLALVSMDRAHGQLGATLLACALQ